MDAQRWPRVAGALALSVLGACGVTLLVTLPHSTSAASLATRSNWELASALPTSRDFPPDWGYSVAGQLRRETPTKAPSAKPASNVTPRQGPAAVYAPAACGNIPKILDQSSGGALAAYVQVDRYTQIWAQDAAPPDAAATGESRQHGPNARFAIWVVPDAASRIADYQDWLGRCGSYRVTNYDYGDEVKNERTVTTVVEAPLAGGVAAVTVTRSFATIGSHDPSSTYHVVYYALRGVLFECSIYMQGADANLVKGIAAHTLQKLRAL